MRFPKQCYGQMAAYTQLFYVSEDAVALPVQTNNRLKSVCTWERMEKREEVGETIGTRIADMSATYLNSRQ